MMLMPTGLVVVRSFEVTVTKNIAVVVSGKNKLCVIVVNSQISIFFVSIVMYNKHIVLRLILKTISRFIHIYPRNDQLLNCN